MLTPLSSAQSAATVSTMQSILETMEDRQREEADRASGRKDDDATRPQIRSDETARQANARINAHFFGSEGRNETSLVKLIARFADALGLSQKEGETGRAFAQRLADAVALIERVEIDPRSRGPLTVTLGSLGTGLDAVKQAMQGGKTDDARAMLVARLATANDVTQGAEESDSDFEQRLTAMLTSLRSPWPADKAALEERAGLDKLGLKVEDLLAAIRNPYGPEANRVKDALADKAREEKALTPEMRKVLARLEDTADPKSIEELKQERAQRDPTRVEDAETRAEREETIKALEAGEKLEDTRDLQEAVAKANEAAQAGGKEPGKSEADPVGEALSTIQVLAAGVEATKRADTEAPRDDTGKPEPEAQTTGEALRGIAQAGAAREAEKLEAQKDIFTLRVDEDGIYDLITRQLVA